MQTIAVCNQKGGVGKTTTVYHLARAAQRRGMRVLVIDMDPQGNLSTALRRDDLPSDVVGVADALSERADEQLVDVIVPTVWERVDLAPTMTATDVLEVVERELIIAGPGAESRLRDQLKQVQDDYDLALIDTRPSLGLLTTNALVASDQVLIVTIPDLFSLDGITKLVNTIEAVRRYYRADLRIGGVLINHREQATTLTSTHWSIKLRNSGLPVLSPDIPKHTWIGAAAQRGEGLDELHARGREVAAIYDRHLTTLMHEPRTQGGTS